MDNTSIKSDRLLHLYSKLTQGNVLRKKELAQQFNVTERSVLRDIETLRCFFAEQDPPQQLIYDRGRKGYRLDNSQAQLLNNGELLAVCKILLESRSLRKDEMLPILDKLIACCVPEHSRKAMEVLIANEKHHYIEPHHGKCVLPGLWEIGQAVQNHQLIDIEYERLKEPKLVRRTIEPVGIMFSEYYFYLVAFLPNIDKSIEFENKDDLFPTIYRIDRIHSFCILDKHFKVPYKDRFQEGEFRKRVQFMFGGKLKKIRFIYTGPSIEAVLDRLPTAKITNEGPGEWQVEAEVFGRGIDMWLNSQGDYIKREGNGHEFKKR